MNQEEQPNPLEKQLEFARRALNILKVKEAGFTSLTIPVHLKLELEDKQQEVDELQNQLLLPSPNNNNLQATPKIYHNLSRPEYGDFVGRDSEKKDVINLLSPSRREWVISIDGVGGVGKSALALEVAYYYLKNKASLPEEEQFGAIIWTSAKQAVLTADGIRNRPQFQRTLEDIITTISNTLEREEIKRARTEEQIALTMGVLAKRRTLLIVDNLETIDDERLLEFLRELPSPSKALVTTRHRIDVSSPVRLLGMSEPETLTLIGHLTHEKKVILSNEEAKKLHRHTGGLPLAIVWSLGLMSFGHSVDSVLTRLGSAKSDIIKFCFQSSIGVIKDQDAYKLLLALSLFAIGASREAVGIVAGYEEDELSRDEGLVLLEKLSLVNKNGSIFSLLSLTKTFVTLEIEKDPSIKLELTERWCKYFLFRFNIGEALYTEIDELIPQIPNLINFLEWCVENNRIEMIVQLLLKNTELLWAKGYWAEEKYYLTVVHNSPILYNEDRQNQAFAALKLAHFAFYQGEIEKSIELYLQTIAIFEELKVYNYLWRAYGRLAQVYAEYNQISEAKLLIEKALVVVKLSDYPERYFSVLQRYRARVLIEEGNLEAAAVLLRQRIADSDNVELRSIDILIIEYALLCKVETLRKNYGVAQREIEKALEIAQAIEIKPDLAFVYQHYSKLKEAIGQISEALVYAQEALELYKLLGMRVGFEKMESVVERLSTI